MSDGSVHVSDPERRSLKNVQGALKVVRTASETVDEELAGIDRRMTTQAEEMQSVLADVSDLSATVEEFAATALEIDQRTTEAAEKANRGRAAASDAMDGMESVRETGEPVAEEVHRLQDRIESIEESLTEIDDVADQTNLLALNASIEAARAGDGSDGFAVVADEVKALAAESQQLSDEIDAALAEVRVASDATVERLEEAIEEITTCAAQVERAATSLDDVAEIVETTSQDVATMADATDDQAQTSSAVADRCEQAAERASAFDATVADIRSARDEQTAMLREIADVMGEAIPMPDPSTVETVPTGLATLDDQVGGLVRGGQVVLRYDGVDVADLVARLSGTALETGLSVSLTPPPGLDRDRLAEPTDASLRRALESDRLFVLDAFDDWRSSRNVFDLSAESLSAVNDKTVRRREQPLLVVGNISAEIRTLGEQQAREARYENDTGVFDAADTVLNVVDDGTVDDTFGAFYAGAADQVFEVVDDGTDPQLIVRDSPTADGSQTVSLPREIAPGANA